MLIREANPADALGIARVHVDSWHTTYKGMIPDDIIASRSYEYRERLWTRTLAEQPETFVYVADEAGEIVGFVSGGSNRDNKLYAIQAKKQPINLPFEFTLRYDADTNAVA